MIRACLLSVSVWVSPSIAGPCAADFRRDCVLNFNDFTDYLSAFAAGSPEAEFTGDEALNFPDVLAFLSAFANGCGSFDADGDRLLDCAETNTGVFVNADDTGTDPLVPDTDDDGLLDGDEVLGAENGLDLPALGVSPLRRDILVEIDWFAGFFQGDFRDFRPTDSALNQIRDCFADAPLQNPDGTEGVNIILDRGQGGALSGGEQLPGSPDVIQFDSDLNMYKASHFDPRRKGYFHYCIFANRYGSSSNSSSGFAEINGDDFIVTLSTYNGSYNAATTFVHEIGHNLGLRHGGFQNNNYKPNYRSVMNYLYQFPGADVTGDASGDGVIDYSRGTSITIDENAIDESDGVTGTIPIDFNRNGFIDPPYAANLNCGFATAPCGSGSNCGDSVCAFLLDQNDWERIRWNRLQLSSDRVLGPVETPTETIECDNWPGK